MPPDKAPAWLLISSVAVLVLTLLFMMALVLLSVSGRQVPSQSRFLVVLVLALGAGFGTWGLSGYAAINGNLPIPGTDQHPIAVSAGGGVAVFLIVLLLGKSIYTGPSSGPEVDLRLDSAKGVVTNQNPERVQIDAKFSSISLDPPKRLFLLIGRSSNCSPTTYRAAVDDPRLGSMTVVLKSEKAAASCARLEVEESPGVVAQLGPETSVQW